jgi:hypothetical protein
MEKPQFPSGYTKPETSEASSFIEWAPLQEAVAYGEPEVSLSVEEDVIPLEVMSQNDASTQVENDKILPVAQPAEVSQEEIHVSVGAARLKPSEDNLEDLANALTSQRA